MISKAEVQALIDDISHHVIRQAYSPAIHRLHEVYAKHLSNKPEHEQVIILTEFLRLVRDSYNFASKAVAVLGIKFAERMNRGLENSTVPEEKLQHEQLGVLLRLGRSVFDGEGNVCLLHNIMCVEFAQEYKYHETKKSTLKARLT